MCLRRRFDRKISFFGYFRRVSPHNQRDTVSASSKNHMRMKRMWKGRTLSFSRSTMSWMSEQASVSRKLSSLAKLISLLSSCSCSRNSCSVTGLSRMVLRGHGTASERTPQNRTVPHGPACSPSHLRDHDSGHHQLVHQLAEVAAHRLPVLQPHVHADRLLLQRLDLTADGRQVALEAAQHPLHPLKEPPSTENTRQQLLKGPSSVWEGGRRVTDTACDEKMDT